jgi:hypothetical protein
VGFVEVAVVKAWVGLARLDRDWAGNRGGLPFERERERIAGEVEAFDIRSARLASRLEAVC